MHLLSRCCFRVLIRITAQLHGANRLEALKSYVKVCIALQYFSVGLHCWLHACWTVLFSNVVISFADSLWRIFWVLWLLVIHLAGFRARVLLFWLRSREREWRNRERIGKERSKAREFEARDGMAASPLLALSRIPSATQAIYIYTLFCVSVYYL